MRNGPWTLGAQSEGGEVEKSSQKWYVSLEVNVNQGKKWKEGLRGYQR